MPRGTCLAAFGAVQTTITESGVGYVKLAYGEVEADFEPGTDAAALAQGAASYTPLLAVCDAGGVDATGITATFEAHALAADPSSARSPGQRLRRAAHRIA